MHTKWPGGAYKRTWCFTVCAVPTNSPVSGSETFSPRCRSAHTRNTQTPLLIAADDAHRMTWCRTQKLCETQVPDHVTSVTRHLHSRRLMAGAHDWRLIRTKDEIPGPLTDGLTSGDKAITAILRLEDGHVIHRIIVGSQSGHQPAGLPLPHLGRPQGNKDKRSKAVCSLTRHHHGYCPAPFNDAQPSYAAPSHRSAT
jgi:hypothetical protein